MYKTKITKCDYRWSRDQNNRVARQLQQEITDWRKIRAVWLQMLRNFSISGYHRSFDHRCVIGIHENVGKYRRYVSPPLIGVRP